MSNDVKKIKACIVARKIALEYDYCLSEEDLPNEQDNLIQNIFGANNISLYELKEACQDHGGNRSDEIETNLISQLSKLLK